MPSLSTSELPPPKDEKEFEEMVRDIFAALWKDPDTKVNGRKGQGQDGVDVYGRPDQLESWFGLQCKLRNRTDLTRKHLESEIVSARSFRHRLHTYIFVTSRPRDTSLQGIVEELNDAEVKKGGFRVQIRFWEDICSLLADHIPIARKYYPQYFRGWISSETSSYQPLADRPSDITPDSPMLVGMIIDLSRSMLKVLRESRGIITQEGLREAINVMVEKASAFCKTPEAEDILPKFSLFVYGYGLGNLRHSVNSLLYRIGVQSQNAVMKSIPTDPVRDLFAEVAAKQSLPFTPDISTLNKNWNHYKKSIEYQFMDMGSGSPVFYESLCQAHNRFCKELERPYYKYPILLVISSGQVNDAQREDVIRISDQIQKLGVQIVQCYVGSKNMTLPKTLYTTIGKNWSDEAVLLFELSSIISDSNQLLHNIAKEARGKGWQIPDQARLFMQVNQSEMLNELIDILLVSLKD